LPQAQLLALPSPPSMKRARRTANCQVGDGDLVPPVRDRLPRADAAPPLRLRLRRVRADGTALDPRPPRRGWAACTNGCWIIRMPVPPKAAGPLLPGRAYSPPVPARPRASIRRTPMGGGKRPEHPDLGSHAAARPSTPAGLRDLAAWRCWTRDGHRLIIPVCDDW